MNQAAAHEDMSDRKAECRLQRVVFSHGVRARKWPLQCGPLPADSRGRRQPCILVLIPNRSALRPCAAAHRVLRRTRSIRFIMEHAFIRHPNSHVQRMLVSIRANHPGALHRQLNLLAAAGTHARAARGQLFSARQRRLPNAPPHRGPACPHPRMLEGAHRGIPLEAFGEIFHVHIAPTEQIRLEGSFFFNPLRGRA
jgi:hypothetical protein